MASIKGISLKSIKDFSGREGLAFSANIYLNNKNVGEVVDEATGSGDFNFYFTDNHLSDEVAKLAQEYYIENPRYFIYFSEKGTEKGKKEGIISELVEELKWISSIEKSYKRSIKKGYPITVAIDFNERTKNIDDSEYVFLNSVIANVQNWDDKIKETLLKEFPEAKIFKAYEKLEDFIIK